MKVIRIDFAKKTSNDRMIEILMKEGESQKIIMMPASNDLIDSFLKALNIKED